MAARSVAAGRAVAAAPVRAERDRIACPRHCRPPRRSRMRARKPGPRSRSAARLPALPAAGRVPGGFARRTSRLVERAGARVRRSATPGSASSASRRHVGREPDRAAVHRRSCRAAVLRDPAQIRARRGPLSTRGSDDGLRLNGCVILNSVKCLPPQNKPLPAEVATCRRYYEAALALLPERAGARRARPDRA